jgi:hypothetical protein
MTRRSARGLYQISASPERALPSSGAALMRPARRSWLELRSQCADRASPYLAARLSASVKMVGGGGGPREFVMDPDMYAGV